MSKYTNKIDQLLKNYSFDDLSDEDKAFVRTEISESEYIQMRKVLVATSAINAAVIPPLPNGIQDSLRTNLKQRHLESTGSKSLRWLSPIFGVMIGALACASWFWYSTPEVPVYEKQIIPPAVIDTIYVNKKDTVYVSIPSKPKVITREIIKYIEREPKNNSTPQIVENSPNSIPTPTQDSNSNNYFNNIELTDIAPTKVGTTIGEEIELMDLLQEMPSDELK